MPAKKRTASQSRWLHEHFSDPYVKQAHKLGLRSRASFKLEELQKKDRLIRQGNIVVDFDEIHLKNFGFLLLKKF